MQRSNFATKLVSILLCLFLLSYLGVSLVQSVRNPLRTAPAITHSAEESFFAPGIIIREEAVITVAHPVVAPLVREGERVSVGMAYMVAYASVVDRERDVRRAQIEQEIAQLETQLAAADGLDQAAGVEAEIRRQIRELSQATRQGNLERLDEQTMALRTLALAGDREGLALRIEEQQAELEQLLGAISAANVTQILAEQAGIYSAHLDGYEYLSPGDLRRFDVQVVQELLARRGTGAQEGAGKIVTGMTWYYVALVPESEAERLAERLFGDAPNRVTVTFSALAGTEIPMRISSLSAAEDGYHVAVFSANTALAETVGLRQVEARIVYDTFAGIRVPREALHWGEPEENAAGRMVTPAYVFTLTLNAAEQKFVEVIYAGSDYYLVQPDTVRTSVAAALREGNTIIVRARDLYDGRVFR
ncbi:MAG: hypothetical protein FWD84_02965 [Oscillospiraceae bacterium]|nr:hypothetical protein [Oscillospiraceae bacterium]